MIEKIKSEIERRTEILTRVYAEMVERKDEEMRTYYHGKIVAIEEFRSFIESLEKEQENRGNFPETSSNFPKIKGWVARDSCEDAFNGCGLILHYSKPWRTGAEWSNRTIAMHLPWGMFQDLKWEDEPIEVELTIRKV